MVRICWQPVVIKGDRDLMTKLLGGHVPMALVTKISGIAIFIRSAERERFDVVDNSGKRHTATALTQLAKAA